MRIQLLKLFIILLVASGIAGLSVLAQTSRLQGATTNDFTITEKTSVSGQSFANTTMIKGARERTEQHFNIPGMPAGMGDSINITQCDLKRAIQLNDRSRKYLITPIEVGDEDSAGGSSRAQTAAGAAMRGGVVTYTTTTRDTGERKQMFGFTARHLKSTMISEPSPDACTKDKTHIERDGWYIDLNVEFSCGYDRPPQMPSRAPRSCEDRIRFRRSGAIKLGFPVLETTTMYGPDGNPTTTITKEVTDISRQRLDAALFDIPAGYEEARNTQELMGTPDVNAMMAQAMGQNRPSTQPTSNNEMPSAGGESKRPGTIRVGVIQLNNKTDHSVSTDSLRERLIGAIQGSNIEAVPLNAISVSEADAEAKDKQCDYILATDITALKVNAAKKLGGMFGRATGVGSGGVDKTESKVEFKLFPIGSSSPSLQSSASGKEEGDDASAGAALDAEAKAVTSAVKKRG